MALHYLEERLKHEHRTIGTAPETAIPISLRQLVMLPAEVRHLLAHLLLPVDLMVSHHIDPITWRNPAGEIQVKLLKSTDTGAWGLQLSDPSQPADPLIELEMNDTSFGRIQVTWVTMNDPHGPRFSIDELPDGRRTLLGKAHRNLEAEAAAWIAGLAPGQVRQGLGRFRELLRDLEQFFAALHQREFEVEPMFYHNAVLFERLGFHYIRGASLMRQIHSGFGDQGSLRARLDGSSPFRDPQIGDTVRGRSWAIHDGILGENWDGVKMLKRIGQRSAETTTPDVPW